MWSRHSRRAVLTHRYGVDQGREHLFREHGGLVDDDGRDARVARGVGKHAVAELLVPALGSPQVLSQSEGSGADLVAKLHPRLASGRKEQDATAGDIESLREESFRELLEALSFDARFDPPAEGPLDPSGAAPGSAHPPERPQTS